MESNGRQLPDAQYDWHLAKDNHYTRVLYGGEYNLDFVDQLLGGNFRLGFIVKFESTIGAATLASRMTQQWKRLRYEYPLLGAKVTTIDGKRVLSYASPKTEADVEKWVAQSLFVYERQNDQHVKTLHEKATLKALPDAVDGVTIKIHLLLGSSKHDIFFESSHAQLDGHGVIMLLKHLLEGISHDISSSSMQWGKEVNRLPVNNIVAMGGFQPGYPTSPVAVAGIERFWKYMTTRAPGWNLPATNTDQPAGATKIALTRLSREESTSVIEKAKSHGITITQLTTAAFTMSLVKHNPPSDQEFKDRFAFIPYAAFNLRPRFIEPYRSDSMNLASTTSPVCAPLHLAKSMDKQALINLALAFKEDYDYWRSWPYLNDFLHDMTETIISSVQTMLATQAPIPPPSPLLSSMGVITEDMFPSKLPGISVDDMYLACKATEPTVILHLWSFQGELRLEWHHVENYYSVETADMLLNEIRQILLSIVETKSDSHIAAQPLDLSLQAGR